MVKTLTAEEARERTRKENRKLDERAGETIEAVEETRRTGIRRTLERDGKIYEKEMSSVPRYIEACERRIEDSKICDTGWFLVRNINGDQDCYPIRGIEDALEQVVSHFRKLGYRTRFREEMYDKDKDGFPEPYLYYMRINWEEA